MKYWFINSQADNLSYFSSFEGIKLKDNESGEEEIMKADGAFIFIGLIPLMVYVWDYIGDFPGQLFFWSSLLTGLGFAIIGYLKSYVTESSALKGIVETLALGLIAAGVAYFVGDLLEKIIV